MDKLLEVQDLEINFRTYGGEVKAVRNVSFQVGKGEIVAIVGESGSGKSVTVKSILGLIPSPPGKIKGGRILFNGEDLLTLTKRQLRKIKGSKISMVFQDPITSLNPTMKVGKQIEESLKIHTELTKAQMRERALEMIELVGIPNPKERYDQYPHQFSGGMRQRIMIAIALACNPDLLIADEPTTALDVTIQAQVLDLMKDLQKKTQSSIILITHDLGVVAETADKVIVMYGGMVVERGTVNEIFMNPSHPYTWGLLESIPETDSPEKKRLVPIEGSPPDLFSPPAGCPFAPRCKYAMAVCESHMPPDFEMEKEHTARCWLHDKRSPNVKELIEVGSELA